ncbi:MAG: phycobilisome protein [Nodosilinea sp.]
MLTDIEALVQATDGRYASDQELVFFQAYLSTVGTRLRAYQKIQAAERQIVAEVMASVKTKKPSVFETNGQTSGQDLATKWQRDTVRVLRYSAVALLLDDPERFKESLLIWFQTIMRAFSAQKSCDLTYTAMQDVIAQFLNPEELRLYLPLLELSRVTLGASA